jgi:hypothetical protein
VYSGISTRQPDAGNATQPATHALRGNAARTMSASTAAHPNPFLHRTYHASSSAIASASVIDVPSLASTPPPAKRRNAFHARVFNDKLPARSYPRIRPCLNPSSSPTGIPVSTSPSTRLVINLFVRYTHVVSRRVRIRFVPPTQFNSKSHSSHAFTRPRLPAIPNLVDR